MAELCENNIDAKNLFNKAKYLIQDLTCIIHYFQQMNLASKAKVSQIYLPFVEDFIKAKALESKKR